MGVEDGTQVEGPSKTRVKCGKPVHSPAPTSTPTDVSSCLLADVPGSVLANPVHHDNLWLLTCGTDYRPVTSFTLIPNPNPNPEVFE